MKLHENCRLRTFDIKDLYVNIPIGETLNITKTLLSKHDKHVAKQTLKLLHTIIQQDYFTFQDIFQPDNGIAMGSSVSRIMAEIFLQYLKGTSKTTAEGKEHHILHEICLHLRHLQQKQDHTRKNPQLHEQTTPKFKTHPYLRTEQ
jgi:hypothetical protein